MARASCSLHLSLLYSDEIILTFSQQHGKSSGAFHTTAVFSIILSGQILFILGENSISYDQFSHILIIHRNLFNNITFALQSTINVR